MMLYSPAQQVIRCDSASVFHVDMSIDRSVPSAAAVIVVVVIIRWDTRDTRW
jgi:hypothetical protein